MVARMFPLFELADRSCWTSSLRASQCSYRRRVGLAATDIKRVIAY
jgi:hypothetical protein